jgi:glycosyltransferase involved in cell wall biosynthesis
MARNIFIDGLFLTDGFSGCGINRYLVNLLREMGRLVSESHELRIRVLLPSKLDAVGDGLVQQNGFEFVPYPAMRFRKLWRLGALFNFTGAAKPDALFLPSPALVLFKPCRLAVTVHDMIPLLFPDQFRSFQGRIFRQGCVSTLRQADLIFTDSEYIKRDIISRYETPQERIVVAHLGFDSKLFNTASLDPEKIRSVLKRYGIGKPYLLYVGALEARKNLAGLVRAYRLLLSRRSSLAFQLVLCGREGWCSQEVIQLSREPDLQGHVILTGAVPDDELTVLYKASAGFVMPSLYEGFGLPPLEAMASGIPVISSDRSCLPEIAGDAAVYFDPESVEQIADAMERLLTDSALREKLIEQGLSRAKQFSWEACARKTLAALREL